MHKTIRCDCGYVAQAKNTGELVHLAKQHARDVHRVEITEEQALAMAKPA